MQERGYAFKQGLSSRHAKNVLKKNAFVMDALHPVASLYALAAVSLREYFSAAISLADWKAYVAVALQGQRFLSSNWKAVWLCTLTFERSHVAPGCRCNSPLASLAESVLALVHTLAVHRMQEGSGQRLDIMPSRAHMQHTDHRTEFIIIVLRRGSIHNSHYCFALLRVSRATQNKH